MFIHGGYWRMFSKGDFSYIAQTITRAGAIAAIVDYALMPAVRMAEIVGQIREAKQWILDNIATCGGDPSRLTVSGHSAGAHLATFLLVQEEPFPPSVKGALLLGGIYDLKPLQASFLQPLIGLTDRDVEEYSPLHRKFWPGISISILHGDRETEPFHQQASAFARHLQEQGCLVSLNQLEHADHMGSVRDLGLPASEAGRYLTEIIRKS
jgi:arylformamidase